VTVAQSGPRRPMCGPLSLVTCMLVQLRMRDACAQPAASLGGGRQPRHGFRLQVRPCRAACARRSGLRQLHRQRGRLETPDRCFSTPTLKRKGCTRDVAAAVRCPNRLRTCIPHGQLHEHTADQAERSAHRPAGAALCYSHVRGPRRALVVGIRWVRGQFFVRTAD
jgi:hypothetical protein